MFNRFIKKLYYHFELDRFHEMIRYFYLSQIFLLSSVYNITTRPFDHQYYQWPLRWFEWTSTETGLKIVAMTSALGIILSLFFYKKRWVRVFNVFFMLLYNASLNVEGLYADHLAYQYFFLSFLFVFVDFNVDFKGKRQSFKISFLSLFLILTPYTISGLKKLANMGLTVFNPNSFNGVLAQMHFELGNSLMFPDIVDVGIWSSPLTLFGISLQISTLVFPFFPKWFKTMGIFLILFHFMNIIFFNIFFIPSMYLIGLFFIQHCFQRKKWA